MELPSGNRVMYLTKRRRVTRLSALKIVLFVTFAYGLKITHHLRLLLGVSNPTNDKDTIDSKYRDGARILI